MLLSVRRVLDPVFQALDDVDEELRQRHVHFAEIFENRNQLVDDQPDRDDHAETIIDLQIDSDTHERRHNQVIDGHADRDEGEVARLFDDAEHADAAVELLGVGGARHARDVIHEHDRHEHAKRNEQNVEIRRQRTEGAGKQDL